MFASQPEPDPGRFLTRTPKGSAPAGITDSSQQAPSAPWYLRVWSLIPAAWGRLQSQASHLLPCHMATSARGEVLLFSHQS